MVFGAQRKEDYMVCVSAIYQLTPKLSIVSWISWNQSPLNSSRFKLDKSLFEKDSRGLSGAYFMKLIFQFVQFHVSVLYSMLENEPCPILLQATREENLRCVYL